MRKHGTGFEANMRRMFFISAIIPVLVLLICFDIFIWFGCNISLKRQTADGGRTIANRMEQINQAYRKACEELSDSTQIRQFIQAGEGRSSVFEEYYKTTRNQNVKFQMALVDQDKQVLLKTNPEDGFQINAAFLPLIRQAEEGSGEVIKLFSNSMADSGKNYWYGFGKVIYEGNKPAGYIIYYTYDKQLRDILSMKGVERVVITNAYDTVIAATNEEARNSLGKMAYDTDRAGYVYVDHEKYYMAHTVLEQDGMIVYTMNAVMFEGYLFRLMPAFILFIVVLLLFVMNNLAGKMSRRVVEPIDELLDTVRRTSKGDFAVRADLSTGDEFEILGEEYNHMTDEINLLIQRNQELSELQRQAEFKVIRNQFNPHFIFNVLETLRYTILMDAKEAEHIVLTLSKFLRYNLYNQDQFVTLEEDLEHLEDFMILHKARFQERMSWEIHMGEGTSWLAVPKFLIQPLVENSIKYGFKNQKTFHITLSSVLAGDKARIIVEDNSGGMAEDRFEQVCHNMQSMEPPDDHIGLYNVNRLVRLIYGEGYGVELQNHVGKGLTVILVICQKKELNDQVRKQKEQSGVVNRP